MMSFSLAMLILLTSFDYTVDMHFCQDSLKSFSFFGHAAKCYEGEAAEQSCDHTSGYLPNQISKKPCCSNKTLHAKLIQNQVSPDQTIPAKSISALIAIVPYSPVTMVKNAWLREVIRWHFKPPSLPKDLLSLLQVFRL